MKEKIVAYVLSLVMIVSSMGNVYADTNTNNTGSDFTLTTDISEHWAKNELIKWQDKGLIKGYEDGTVKPDGSITRAEFFALVNRIFNFKGEAEIVFDDVSEAEWYSEVIKKSVAAGYLKGYQDENGVIAKPNAPINRQEASAVLCRVFELVGNSDNLENTFIDYQAIEGYAKQNVNALLEKGYIKGYENQTFRPNNNLTRAEAVKMIDSIVGEIYNQSGSYTGKYNNIVINTGDIMLKDTTINGNLYLTEGIAEGNVYLENVTVIGDTVIKGGGLNSIIINNSNLKNIKVKKNDSKIRVVLSGTTKSSGVSLESGAMIQKEKDNVSDIPVRISENIQDGAKVTLKGDYAEVNVDKAVSIETAADSSIGQLNLTNKIQEGAKIILNGNFTRVNMDKAVSVESAADTKISELRITDRVQEGAKVTLSGTFDKITVDKGVEITTNNTTIINVMNIASTATGASLTGEVTITLLTNSASGVEINGKTVTLGSSISVSPVDENITTNTSSGGSSGDDSSTDSTAPVITLVGQATVNVASGNTYTDAGATASDNIDGTITANIVKTITNGAGTIIGSINTSVSGTYTIHYNISDATGNAATEVTRTVIVGAIEILAKASFTGAFTSDVKVRVNGGFITGYSLYYKDQLVTTDSDNDGVVRTISNIFNNLGDVKVRTSGGVDITDSDITLGAW
ncbi:MAG TPA: hypothetical protein DEP72_00480 [Clostridiales bacterium]|nr:MAG: hypothetical protein A2Y18_03265 [Clostridiales bacterium GWD2_32_19]HCC06627.1 hypothetical protein [Clostridiales bacterium]